MWYTPNMKNLLLEDEWKDQMEFEIDSEIGRPVVITRTEDVEGTRRIGVVALTEAQARELYMWLAEAIGVVEKGYNERHGG
jgi:hypothetical protein